MADYKPSLSDRLGPDGPAVIQAAVWAVVLSPLGGLIAGALFRKFGGSSAGSLFAALAGMVVGGLLVFWLQNRIPASAGAAMSAVLLPSGDSTPYESDYSYESALEMRGDVTGALASYEEKITSQPGNTAVRLVAAELYARSGNLARARDLFREVQRTPGIRSNVDVLASYRLIDLYRGKMGEPAKSLPEFRRLIERYPDTDISKNAREALAHLKKEMSFD